MEREEFKSNWKLFEYECDDGFKIWYINDTEYPKTGDYRIRHSRDTKGKDSFFKAYPCPACHGTGRIAQYAYYEGGICFKCMNNPSHWVSKNVPRVYKTEEGAKKALVRLQEEQEKEHNEWLDKNEKFANSKYGKAITIIQDNGKKYRCYDLKEDIKSIGGRWCPEGTTWFIKDATEEQIKKISDMNLITLTVETKRVTGSNCALEGRTILDLCSLIQKFRRFNQVDKLVELINSNDKSLIYYDINSFINELFGYIYEVENQHK